MKHLRILQYVDGVARTGSIRKAAAQLNGTAAAGARRGVVRALAFGPPFLATFQPLMSLEQRIVAIMSAKHPLAARRTVRLRDCAAYPVALPERSIGGRQLLEEVIARSRITFQIGA